MDRTTKQTKPEESKGAEQSRSESTNGKYWSPLSTDKAKWSWGLMTVFTIIYFSVAILTSAEFAELAATLVLGLPLGFWLGIGVIIAGLVITRIYLVKVED